LRTHECNDAGYTLLGLLVVMGILAVLTAVARPQPMGYFGEAKTQSVQLRIENIGTIGPVADPSSHDSIIRAC
jgi:general secretion pathway protein G